MANSGGTATNGRVAGERCLVCGTEGWRFSEVRLKGEFVIVTISVDEDDWDTPLLR